MPPDNKNQPAPLSYKLDYIQNLMIISLTMKNFDNIQTHNTHTHTHTHLETHTSRTNGFFFLFLCFSSWELKTQRSVINYHNL